MLTEKGNKEVRDNLADDNSMSKVARKVFLQGYFSKVAGMDKKADRLANELILGGLSNTLLLPPLSPIGYYTGLMGGEEGTTNKSQAYNLLPGVGAYNTGTRVKIVVDESRKRGGRGYRGILSEHVGPYTSIVASGLAGSLVGALSSKGVGYGASAGAAIGGGLGLAAAAGGTLLAALTKRRSLDEQAATDTGGREAARYLVPGVAKYDYWKRLGASRNLIEDKQKKEKEDKEKEDKKEKTAQYLSSLISRR